MVSQNNYVENYLNFVPLQMTLRVKGQGIVFPTLDFIIPSKIVLIFLRIGHIFFFIIYIYIYPPIIENATDDEVR